MLNKIIILVLFMQCSAFALCIDIGLMYSSALVAKASWNALDKVMNVIIKQVKDDEEKSKQYNLNASEIFPTIQVLDKANTLNTHAIYFNTQMINQLESIKIDSKSLNVYKGLQ